MTTVIEFRYSICRAGPRDGAEPTGEIIIFPGVRRERHSSLDPEADEMQAKPKRQGRAKPKRDRIELPD
jgi:hypothetical protein